jgi:hypothetical protein
MSFFTYGRFRRQVRSLRRRILQDGKLPFTDVLSDEAVGQALTALNTVWPVRIRGPPAGKARGVLRSGCPTSASLPAHELASDDYG